MGSTQTPFAGSKHTWHGIASHLSVSCTAMHGVPCVRCVLFAMRHALGMTMFKTKSAPAVCRLLQVLGAAPAGAPHDACNGGPRAQADSTARVDAWDINHQRLARHCMRGSGCVAGVQGMVVGIGKWRELRSVPGPGCRLGNWTRPGKMLMGEWCSRSATVVNDVSPFAPNACSPLGSHISSSLRSSASPLPPSPAGSPFRFSDACIWW